jgi:hypothetical protein
MAKVPAPTGTSLDMGNCPVMYADGLDEVDHYGPNARLTFWMTERYDDKVQKSVVVKVIIPTAELVRIARQLLLEDAPDEQPARIKQVATLQ